MVRGQTFEDFLHEELSEDKKLSAEVHDAFDDMRLAVALAMHRERIGMSQQALALRSGVTQPMISRIERGDQQPTWPTIRRLITALSAGLMLQPDGSVELRDISTLPALPAIEWSSVEQMEIRASVAAASEGDTPE